LHALQAEERQDDNYTPHHGARQAASHCLTCLPASLCAKNKRVSRHGLAGTWRRLARAVTTLARMARHGRQRGAATRWHVSNIMAAYLTFCAIMARNII